MNKVIVGLSAIALGLSLNLSNKIQPHFKEVFTKSNYSYFQPARDIQEPKPFRQELPRGSLSEIYPAAISRSGVLFSNNQINSYNGKTKIYGPQLGSFSNKNPNYTLKVQAEEYNV